MKIEIFVATIRHDNGIVKLKVVSLNGKGGAIQQITAIEGCPKSAIVDLVKIGSIKNI